MSPSKKPPPKTILLYQCPGLEGNARITRGQCGRNRRRAQRAAKAKRYTIGCGSDRLRNPKTEALIFLEPCLECDGVFELAKAGKIPKPTRYDGPMVRARPKRQYRPKRIGHNVWIRHQAEILSVAMGEGA